MRREELHEPVKVRADFSGGEVTPLAFKHNARAHKVERVNARWTSGPPGARVHSFSVEAGDETYELSLRTQDMMWFLEAVTLEG